MSQQPMNEHYVGLDVSLDSTAVCVIDAKGTVIWRGKCTSDPDAITETIHQRAPAAVRVGLETGQLSNWLPRDNQDGNRTTIRMRKWFCRRDEGRA